MDFSVLAILIGFMLPWQTRLLLRVPAAGGVTWDFGVLSIFISQIVIAAWLMISAWEHRKEIVAWFSVKQWSARKIIGVSAGVILVVMQIAISLDPLLTVQWLFSIGLLGGLGLLLHKNPKNRIPFVAAFMISVVLQALLAAMQVFASGTFASSALGIAAHKAVNSGTAVIEYAGTRYIRAYGGQPHPNVFGGLTLVTLVLFGWMLKYKKTLGVKKNIIQFVLVVVGALFFTFSRTAWIGFIFWILALWRERKTLRESQFVEMKWSVVTFVILLAVFFPLVISRTIPTTPIEQRSITERGTDAERWKAIAKQYWLTGTGAGAYTAALTDMTGDRRVPVHSVPLVAVAEFGVLGFVLLGVIAWSARLKLPRSMMLLVIIPIALLDHYLYSLWSGHVVLFAFLFQLLEVGNNDEADNNQQ